MSVFINIIIILNVIGIILAIGLGIFLRTKSLNYQDLSIKATNVGSIKGNIKDKASFSFLSKRLYQEEHLAHASERLDFKTTYIYEKDNYLACP